MGRHRCSARPRVLPGGPPPARRRGRGDRPHRLSLGRARPPPRPTDPFDERAHRDLMRALVADGRPTAALDVHQELAAPPRRRARCRPGPRDPAPPSRDPARRAARRRRDVAPGPAAPAAPSWAARRSWPPSTWPGPMPRPARPRLLAGHRGPGHRQDPAARRGRRARRTHGWPRAGHRLPPGRALAVPPAVPRRAPPRPPHPAGRDASPRLLGPHLATWGRLLPELAEVLEIPPEPEVSHDLARRRSFDAVVAVARRPRRPADPCCWCSTTSSTPPRPPPTCSRTSGPGWRPAPVLLVAGVRSEALPALGQVTDAEPARSTSGPLPPSAVDALATAAGFAARAAEVQARSLGHPLSVVASLQALAVRHRRRTRGHRRRRSPASSPGSTRATADIGRAAAVLGTSVDPLLAQRPPRPLRGRGRAGLRARSPDAGLMTVRGTRYAFVNDLVRDAVLATLAPPVAVAYHRRAADLLADRPEEMAGHAHEAGDAARAAAGYLEAGRIARRVAALDDALALLSLALDGRAGCRRPRARGDGAARASAGPRGSHVVRPCRGRRPRLPHAARRHSRAPARAAQPAPAGGRHLHRPRPAARRDRGPQPDRRAACPRARRHHGRGVVPRPDRHPRVFPAPARPGPRAGGRGGRRGPVVRLRPVAGPRPRRAQDRVTPTPATPRVWPRCSTSSSP